MPFRFRPRRNNQGFDGYTMPETQIIPLGERRTVIAAGRDHLVPRMKGGGKVKLTFNPTWPKRWRGRLELEATAAGEETILWVPDPKSTASVPTGHQLKVCVLGQLQFRTSFHFVTDGPGDARERKHTIRKLKIVEDLIEGANRILQPQANIVLIEESAAPLKLDRELGPTIELSNKRPIGKRNWTHITNAGNKNAQLNVFLLWDINVDDVGAEDTIGAGRAGDANVMIDDGSANPHVTLAHEFLHVLGRDHTENRTHLMAETYEDGGIFIPAKQAFALHAFARSPRRLGTYVENKNDLIRLASYKCH